jgi:hydroxyacylglutathione hydrolase
LIPAPPLGLAPGLWTTRSPLYATHSGVFVSDVEAGLVDPGIFPAELRALRRFLDERGLEPQWILLTHAHWDHLLGPERFPGVPVVAHSAYRAETAEPLRTRIQHDVEAWEARFRILREGSFEPPEPDREVEDGDRLALGDRTLDLIHVPGHAADQVAVHDPAAGILWAADTLSDLEIPFVSHGLEAYVRTLDRLAELDIRVLVPGHGSPTSDPGEIQRRIEEDQAYLVELAGRVDEALRLGLGLEETVALCGSMRFRRPEENTEPHCWNVETLYAQRGGDADPLAVGWNR